jgi:hypothetical protein
MQRCRCVSARKYFEWVREQFLHSSIRGRYRQIILRRSKCRKVDFYIKIYNRHLIDEGMHCPILNIRVRITARRCSGAGEKFTDHRTTQQTLTYSVYRVVYCTARTSRWNEARQAVWRNRITNSPFIRGVESVVANANSTSQWATAALRAVWQAFADIAKWKVSLPVLWFTNWRLRLCF